MMPRRSYTVTVLGCALAWLLVGLHLPVFHDLGHADAAPHWGLIALTLVLIVLALGGTASLLRAPSRWGGGESRPPAA